MIKNGNLKDLVFQVSEWDYYHEEDGEGNNIIQKYVIRIYGTTEDNKKIFVKVKNFTPYFYVRIPKNWKKHEIDFLIRAAKSSVSHFSPINANGLKDWEVVDKNIFWEFTNYEIFPFVRLVFHSYDSFRAYERVFNRPLRVFGVSNVPMKFSLYESNIEPLIRFMHIRKIDAFGWIKIAGGKYTFFPDNSNPSNNDISVHADWTNLDPVDNKTIVPLIIAAFDIECTSGDGTFPQPHRDDDRVIQIGTTFSRYGESECFYKHIITLGTCDKIEGVDVESYDSEVKVLLAWTKLIIRTNPDIITGYNIFGFDFTYLEKRAKKLGCHESFSKLGRIRNVESPFIHKELKSAALGDNKLYYYAIQGRIQIDIMKVVMRDFKLGSYKLDNVAGEFIRDKIVNIDIDLPQNKTTIYTKNNTYGLEVGRYIKIYFNDGLSDNAYKNSAKFKVLSVSDKIFTIIGILDSEALEIKKFDVYWSQAKDDIDAKDIFRLQKGNSADRAIIAKYCIYDCVLCNKLMNKLQILTNNIGMSNVCHVPLSYIFLRGQGIKVFSLVSKKCREKGHVIPVIKKPYIDKNKLPDKNEEKMAEDEDGYEGATVFEPHVGIHYEPITVLDYNSLYPNSMRFRNISHECIVKNKKYEDLPGYYYEEVTYNNKDGTPTTCTYAKAKNGTVGILPEILTDLLNARSQMRDLAEQEKDPFKKKILDGLQLAYKMTANALYGQCGAKVSSIHMKDIAASTTATGRELLNAAKIFTEIIFPIIVHSALYESYEIYEKNNNLLFNKEIDKLIGEQNINKLKKENEMINIWGNKILDDDGNVMIEEAKYKYLNIFKNNKDLINDKKFMNNKLGISNKEDAIKWLHGEINKLFVGQYTIKPIVIYGDSVPENEPVMVLNTQGTIEIKQIKELTNHWQSCENFKHSENNGYFVQIVKQYYETNDQTLLKYLPLILQKIVPQYHYTLGEIEEILLNDQNARLNKEHGTTDYKIYTNDGWMNIKRVIRHKTDKKIYRIITGSSIVDVTEDHSLIDINGNYVTPKECFDGLELSNGFPININNLTIVNNCAYLVDQFCSSNKEECMKYYVVSKHQGYNIKIEYHDPNYILIRTKDQIVNSHKIIKIIPLTTTASYVYDLETENGKFNAGIGELTIKNTDSIFINYQIRNGGEKTPDALKISIRLGQLCEYLLHKILPYPLNMGYEKTFDPLALLSKKRYVGNKYEFSTDHFYQASMGIVLKRRDNAPIVKIVVGGIVKSILNEKDPEKAIKYTKKVLRDILAKKYPLDKFIITKTLKGNGLTEKERQFEQKKPKEERAYSDRSTIVHAVLADRIADRDPGNRPQSNERIPFAYILKEGKVELQGERVETPEYIIQNNLELDYLFYITNQIMKPTIQFLEHITNNPKKVFEECIIKETNRRKGKRPLNYYFGLEDKGGETGGFNCHENSFTPNKKVEKKPIKGKLKKVNKSKIIKFTGDGFRLED